MAILPAFLLFATVMLFTPGPNNIMLLASGVNFGLRRTMPHVMGVAAGFAFMVAVMGLGLGAVFLTWPVLQTALKFIGAVYLVYLAAMIAMSGPVETDEQGAGRPMSFFGAALFQWVNAKGWVMAVTTITAYSAIAAFPWNVAAQVILLFAIGVLSSIVWAMFGQWLRPLLRSPRAVRAFNVAMALLLLASLYPVLADA